METLPSSFLSGLGVSLTYAQVQAVNLLMSVNGDMLRLVFAAAAAK